MSKKTPKAPEFSFFINNNAHKPTSSYTLASFIDEIKNGKWKKPIENLRSQRSEAAFKKAKNSLPAVTVSGLFITRDKAVPVEKRLKTHTSLICIDVDKKDNPKMRIKDLIDPEALAQFTSCSGEGKKIIYSCAPTRDPAVHRRIYDAVIKRLADKGITIKVDPIVKSIASLQYVSFDSEAYYNPKSKLVIKPLPPIKIKKVPPSEDQEKEIEQLKIFISELGDKDTTEEYENWLTIGLGLSYSLGESGRPLYHALSKNYEDYNKGEVDEKYDGLLETDKAGVERPVTLASVYQIIYDYLPKAAARKLAKQYSQSHAVGVGEEIEQGDLAGYVRFKLFLFKKLVDKEGHMSELKPLKLNLNEFEKLLKSKGFYRYDKLYVHIQDNIVEHVDEHDILRLITRHIEQDGNYEFSYKQVMYEFSWEELVHLWREVRAQGTTFNQIATCLEHWVPNLLSDDNTYSYIPYKNGVVRVSGKGHVILPYSGLKQQIWKEHILPRDFKFVPNVGMFEEFFANVCGRGKNRAERIKSPTYKRSLWYYGYMLHGFKVRSLARAWMLYDVQAGNNGRTGKSILGEAVGNIRSMVTVDGKRVDFTDKFALQKVNPWTKVLFIDDPKKGMSIAPLFNMITGSTDAESKSINQITLPLKVMIAANWIMELEGTSEQGRQFITQLSAFYVEYGKAHDNSSRPIWLYHGKDFFTEWDDKDWKRFDSFAIKALTHYFTEPCPDNVVVGNTLQIRFIQQHDMEMFYALADAFIRNAKVSPRDGNILISQRVLAQVVKDSMDFSAGRCGKIVREFLSAIKSGPVKITTMTVANMNHMAYKIEKKPGDLDFGDEGKNLPRFG